MSIKIFKKEHSVQWLNYLNHLPKNIQDIYASPYYVELYENLSYGTAECFLYEEGDKFVLYPYLRNDINSLNLIESDNTFYDIQGVYGYNGPLTNCTDHDFLKRFSERFITYCENENIIAEFTRFNPIVGNQNWLVHVNPVKANDVVNVDLSISEKLIWSEFYERDIRRIINKGIKMGYWDRTMLLSEADDRDVEDFKLIYYSTLNRIQADKFYYFDDDYFYKMKQKLSKNVLLSLIYDADRPFGASINPFSGIIGYGFLGGSLGEYKKVSPFTFMMHKVALKFKEFGIRNYLLGGGNKPGDSLFKYKRSFSINGVIDFYIGKKIHNKRIYDLVCKAWEEKFPEKKEKYKNYLLKYRY